jgi:hypothetical protein
MCAMVTVFWPGRVWLPMRGVMWQMCWPKAPARIMGIEDGAGPSVSHPHGKALSEAIAGAEGLPEKRVVVICKYSCVS